MITNMDYEFIVSWDEFPESFLEKWEDELFHADVEDNGVVCDINFDYQPYCPGRYDGKPENCYPASGPDLDINSMCLTVYPQRAATHPIFGRQYITPHGYLTVATDHLRPFDDKFLEVAHQFALDWMDMNQEKVESFLAAWAATQNVENEIDSILSSMFEEGYS